MEHGVMSGSGRLNQLGFQQLNNIPHNDFEGSFLNWHSLFRSKPRRNYDMLFDSITLYRDVQTEINADESYYTRPITQSGTCTMRSLKTWLMTAMLDSQLRKSNSKQLKLNMYIEAFEL
eukprot:GHVR01180542.1.p1 GENE.GHVR01180542.1~~GHVR01180542.1.p1  ORF type:complete len:119 (+),score=4.17 GHVR01180542.1:245-601(+)